MDDSRNSITLLERLQRRAQRDPDGVFMQEVGGESYTASEFLMQTYRYASAFEKVGVQAGDRVAAMLPQRAQSHLFWLGAGWLRAPEVPINSEYRGRFLVHALNDSGAKVLVTTRQVVPQVLAVVDELAHLETIVLADSDDEIPWRGRTIGTTEFLAGAQPVEREAPALHDVCVVIYTSGTTGPSKGVVTHWAFLPLTVEAQFPGDRPGDYPGGAIYMPWPVFHGTGKHGIEWALVLDLRIVIREQFSVSAFWDDVREYNCTHVNLIGFGSLLLNRPESPLDSKTPLQRALMLPVPKRYREFEKRFNLRISTIWGMTEIGLPVSTGNPPNHRAAGKLLDGYEARLVDENDYEVPRGEPGEFIVRTDRPWVMMTEYLGRPEATAKAWRNGWFHTGDILRQDEEGYYYFVDRSADYLRRKGENISSLEVEAAVTAHPDVESCACIGAASAIAALDGADLDDSDVTQDLDVRIVVSLVDDSALSEQALFDYLAAQMPRHMLPRYIEFVAEMPRTPTMKIRKAELRKRPIDPSTVWDRERHGTHALA